MRCSQVLEQHSSSLEVLGTLWTLTKHLGLVRPHVIVESAGLNKPLTTFFAHIWSFISMDPYMAIEIADVRECLVTDIATVILDSSVNVDMVLQIRLLVEPLATCVTLELGDLVMGPLYVILQLTLSVKV